MSGETRLLMLTGTRHPKPLQMLNGKPGLSSPQCGNKFSPMMSVRNIWRAWNLLLPSSNEMQCQKRPRGELELGTFTTTPFSWCLVETMQGAMMRYCYTYQWRPSRSQNSHLNSALRGSLQPQVSVEAKWKTWSSCPTWQS